EDHRTAAAGAAMGWGWCVRFVGRWRGWRVEQLAAERQLVGAVTVGEEAVVTDAMEAVRQGVQQEAADELIDAEAHDLRLAVVAIVLPTESDIGLGEVDEA